MWASIQTGIMKGSHLPLWLACVQAAQFTCGKRTEACEQHPSRTNQEEEREVQVQYYNLLDLWPILFAEARTLLHCIAWHCSVTKLKLAGMSSALQPQVKGRDICALPLLARRWLAVT